MSGAGPNCSGEPLWWWMEVERREAGREEITYQIYMGAGGVDRELRKDETL